MVEDRITEEAAAWRRSNRARGKGDDAKGGAGRPVNSCTMARKLDVSVVSTVVDARRDARDRFLELRGGAAAAAAGPGLWGGGTEEGCCNVGSDDDGDGLMLIPPE